MLPIDLPIREQESFVLVDGERGQVAESGFVRFVIAGLGENAQTPVQGLAFLAALVVEVQLPNHDRLRRAEALAFGEGLEVRSQSGEIRAKGADIVGDQAQY